MSNITPAYSYRDGKLCVERVKLEDIVAQAPTPLFVYSQQALTEAWQAVNKAFAELDPIVCFAVKANSSKAVLAVLASQGAGADIVSGGEMRRAVKAGIPAGKIVYSGVGKSFEEIKAALRANIMMINAESADELDMINEAAISLNCKAPVAFRVNPDVDAKTHPKITTGLATNKFGLSMEEAFIQYQRAAAMPGITLRGISCHIGSQLTEVAPFVDAAKRLASLVARLKEAGITLRYFDLGGGLGIVYKDEAPPSWQEYADAIIPVVKPLGMRLVLEPGRSIVGNAGALLTQVILTKKSPAKNFVVVDAAMNDLMRPSMYDAYHEIKPFNLNLEVTPQVVDVVGPICESGDYLAKSRELPPCASGDYLAVMSAGAYGSTMSSNYNSRPLAAEVMVNGSQWQLVRPRQQVDDIYAGELMPQWLERNGNEELSLAAGLEFTKMSGAGNDFIVVDNRITKLPLAFLRKLASRICPRAVAVGADGFIALRHPTEKESPFGKMDFAWDFINADGSLAEMCGNGARCAARFAYDIGLASADMIFSTIAGPIRATIRGEEVKVALTPPQGIYFDVEVEAAERTFCLMGANTGVPHTVVMCDNLEDAPIETWGRALRFHEQFGPKGTNVNFAQLVDDMLMVRTYERGVEAETLACGTGSVASALTAAIKHNLPSPVKVKVRSGEVLKVYFSLDEQGAFHDVMLEGGANYIYKGRLAAQLLA